MYRQICTDQGIGFNSYAFCDRGLFCVDLRLHSYCAFAEVSLGVTLDM